MNMYEARQKVKNMSDEGVLVMAKQMQADKPNFRFERQIARYKSEGQASTMRNIRELVSDRLMVK